MRIPALLLLLLALGGAASAPAVDDTPDRERIAATASRLLAIGDRSMGLPGAAQAADCLAAALVEAGFAADEILRCTTTVSVPVDRGSTLTIGDRTLPLHPHVPNGAATAGTGGQPVTGRLLFLGAGTSDILARQGAALRGAIVVLDGDSGAAWMQCAELGAAAAILLPNERMDRHQIVQQSLTASIAFPRLVGTVPPDCDGRTATVTSTVAYEQRPAHSLAVRIRGTSGAAVPDTTILAAGYEAGGVIPGCDPAATRAWNAALLVELARQLKADPPRCDLIAVWHGGRGENLRGLRQILAALCDAPKAGSPLCRSEEEARRLRLDLWRADTIAGAFARFVQDPSGGEAGLAALLAGFDAASLSAFTTEAEPVPTMAVANRQSDQAASFRLLLSRVLAGLLLGGFALLVVVRVRTSRPGMLLLTGAALIAGFGAWRTLSPASAQVLRTSLDAEHEKVRTLAFRFIAEEAARRADANQPVLERARTFQSLSAKKAPTEHDRIKIGQLREELAKLLPDGFDPARCEATIKESKDKMQLWRGIQQKFGKRALAAAEAPHLRELVMALTGSADGTPSNLDRHRGILRQRIADLDSALALRRDLGQVNPVFCLGFDLADGNTRFAACAEGGFVGWKDKLTWLYGEARRAADELNEGRLQNRLPFDRSPYAETSSAVMGAWPKGYLHEAGVAGLFVHALTLSTIHDNRARLGSPADTATAFVREAFLAQTEGMTAYVRALVSRPALAQKRSEGAKLVKPWKTVVVETRSEGSTTGRKGFPYPYVEVREAGWPGWWGDVRPVQTFWGDAFGEVVVPWLPEKADGVLIAKLPVTPYGFDANGRISEVWTTGRKKTAGVDNTAFDLKNNLRDLLTQVFPCEASSLFCAFDPRIFSELKSVRVLSATRESEPDYSAFEFDRGAAAVFAPRGTRLRILAREGVVSYRMGLLGDHLDGERFLGIEPGGVLTSIPEPELAGVDPAPAGAVRRPVPGELAVASDTVQINRARLDNLQAHGVNPESLWDLHAESQRHLDRSRQALAAGDLPGSRGAAQAAWAVAGRVYPAVLSVAKDVVNGLVIMLLLAIPFALICERLFVAGRTIFSKVAGFAGFFSATFLFFFIFHPAFALAKTPIIIFLAFIIIVMSSLVISILYRKFEYTMEQVRMAGLGTHKADVNRLGTLLATGQLGISNMRRRPMRTVLTATTVVLMTFILLTFAGFGAKAGLRVQDESLTPAYNGILLRNPGWLPFPDSAVERLRNTWSRELQVFERRWLMADAVSTRFTISRADGTASANVLGLVGVRAGDPTGIDRSLVRAAADGAGEAPRGMPVEGGWIFLPAHVLEALRCRPGDEVLLRGERLRAGLIDDDGDDAVSRVTHLGGEPFTPLAPEAMDEEQRKAFEEMRKQAAEGQVVVETQSLAHLDPQSVAYAPVGIIGRLGGEVRTIALAPWSPAALARLGDGGAGKVRADDLDLQQVAAGMAEQLAITLRVGNQGTTTLVTAVGQLNLGGLGEVLIPLILGGLIIFSTMLGSVAERGKEIFIYSSLGLAPLHVAALFLVEAGIYAILGGLGGYIVAQALISVIGLMVRLDILAAAPDINYSSFTAVATILMVMGTVLLSALYPAWVASRAANPGIDRAFKVPEPKGDDLDIEFPFTVAARDIRGLLAFLRAYLEANTEASTGCFTAADVAMACDGSTFEVRARTWLAPFDLGISQSFHMTARPTDMKAIYSIHIALRLLSGQRNAWRRVTIPFIKDLRQQFLVWRTLDDETTDRYRAAGGDAEATARVAQRQREAAEATRAVKPMTSAIRRDQPPAPPATGGTP